MPTITADAGVVTQINVFDVLPGQTENLIALLQEAASACRANVPGWLSASLHVSDDGRRVVNYAQTRDRAAMGAVFAYLTREGFLERNRAFGVAGPGLYEVVWTLER